MNIEKLFPFGWMVFLFEFEWDDLVISFWIFGYLFLLMMLGQLGYENPVLDVI